MAEDWRTSATRHRIIQQIDDHLKQTPDSGKRSAAELENSIYQKATKKDEYLQYVSKIIMYLKDQAQNTNTNSSNLTAMLATGQQNTNTVQPSIGQGVTSGGQMTLVNGGNQIIHNQQQMGGGSHPHTNTSGGQITHVGISSGQNMGIGGMMTTSPMVAGPNRMPHAMQANINQGDMTWQAQTRIRRPNMAMKHPGVMTNMPGQVRSGTMPMQMPVPNDPGVNPMAVGQMPRQMQPRVPSPSFMTGPHQRGTSPNIAASPGSQHLQFVSPSPSTVPSPSPVSAGRGMNQHGVPSPSNSMINTPGPQPSPASAVGSMEDIAYTEKVKQLQDKHLNTLREVAQKFVGTADSDSARKVRNLLEIIENPHRRCQNSMETLKRCEIVLERIEIQHGNRNDTEKNQHKENNNPVGVLFDAIQLALKSSFGYHTINRTLGPALKTLMGPDLEPPPPKKLKVSKTNQPSSASDSPIISEIIQGEVARLPPRFKANLDSHQPIGSDNLTLVCQLDDPNLPCIPPISLIIPPDYPNAPPKCLLSNVDYDTTPFLKKIKGIMLNRQFHLPEICSITMLLDSWEMSVRRACSNQPFVPDAIDPLTNLSIFS